jgi:hypothetical protein
MIRTVRRYLTFIALAVLLHSGQGLRAVFACTPPPGGLPVYSAAERAEAAEIVLEGTVLDGSTEPGWPEEFVQIATVEVNQYLKGTGPEVVTIRGFGPTSVCLTPVQVGDHKIFYASGDPAQELRAHYLSQFDAAESPNPETIAEITAAVGQTPFHPGNDVGDAPTTLVDVNKALEQNRLPDWLLPIAMIVTAIVILGLVIILWVWRGRN